MTLESPPLELAGDQFVAAHGGGDILLPVLGEGAPACLLRMKLGWVPFWFIVLQDGNADRLSMLCGGYRECSNYASLK